MASVAMASKRRCRMPSCVRITRRTMSSGPRPGPSPPSREMRFPVLSTMVTRAKVRHIAAHRLHGAEFADVADRALAGWHEQAARTVQVVPLRLVLAVAIEHLHAMVLAVGHIHPAIGIAGDVVRDVELARIGARPAPGEEQLAVRRV